MLAEVDGVREELDELRGLVRGRVAIGALLPAGEIEVTTLLARFAHAFPGIEVGLREGTAADMLELIEADELDVAFSLDRPATLPDGIEGAAAERGGGGRRLPARAPRRAGDVRHAPPTSPASRWRRPRSGSAIKRGRRRVLRRAGERLRISLESGDPYLIRCLVSDGFGAAVLPASITRREGPPVETRPLRPAVRLPVLPGLAPRPPPLGAPPPRSSSSSAASGRARGLSPLPVARVAGRDPVARPGSPAMTSTGGGAVVWR